MRGQIEHTETIETITYTLSIEEDDQPVRGNASAIDPETDREAEDLVYAQLRQGNLRAWCVVTVTASIERDGLRFKSQEHLGACSFRNRQEFMQPGGCWEDMRTEARLSLQAQLLRAATHGTIAL